MAEPDPEKTQVSGFVLRGKGIRKITLAGVPTPGPNPCLWGIYFGEEFHNSAVGWVPFFTILKVKKWKL